MRAHIRNGLSEARVHRRRVIRAHSYLIKRVKKHDRHTIYTPVLRTHAAVHFPEVSDFHMSVFKSVCTTHSTLS